MAELYKIRFLIFVSLMIFPARALDVILSGAHENFKQKSEIEFDIKDGEKIYRGTLNHLTYEAENGTSKVIVYIISKSRCIEILRPAGEARETRSQIARALRGSHCELVFLGIEHFDDDENHLIGAFILDKIQRHPDQTDFTIETIGENRFDQYYRCHERSFEKCQEYAQALLAWLTSIPEGAVRPVGRNDKEMRLLGYHPFESEVSWPVNVENGTYVPNVDISDSRYNFMIKYPDKKICLLILGGKEYLAKTSYGNRRLKRRAMRSIFNTMERKDEVLIILGVFNFDWTEIGLVTQIILKHSEGLQSSDYNVFTCGYGMFNTYYLNEDEGDERDIRKQPNSTVSKALKRLMDGEVNERVIKVYYSYDYKWKDSKIPINLINGRYAPELRFDNFTLSSELRNQKIAFIVFDRAEMNNATDYLIMIQSVEELKRSGISVVLIKATNFGLDDMHIIAEWIDYHSGVNDSEQIAVLGGGIFDTIFQSESTTYNKFLNTKKNELETIRNFYVRSGNAKSVFAAGVDDYSNLRFWSCPMNSAVNGFYELDLIPDKNMLKSTGRSNIYFIVTSAYNFQEISAKRNLGSFGQYHTRFYPNWKWSIFLVYLDNFEERDSHLFAELVKRQTNDGTSFGDFVRVLSHDINQTIYQYKDAAPFDADGSDSYMHERFTLFLEEHVHTSP